MSEKPDTARNSPPRKQAEDQSDIWNKIRMIFSTKGDATLRSSLENVIEQHNGDENDALVRPEARSMMLNLLKFPDVRVDDIMVPRADIFAIEDSVTVNELLDAFTEANHSRIPIYKGTLDDPLGMVHIKDLMRWLAIGDQIKPAMKSQKTVQAKKPARKKTFESQTAITETDIIREVLFVPPSMPAADLLMKMQSTHIHLAIVVDEYGGTDGLVSIEDVVEEIVGEIADEHDDETDLIVQIEDGNYVADARTPIEDVEKVLKIDLLPDEQDEDTDTLGGFIFSMLGRVPVRGEIVAHESGIEFEVLQADARRVNKLKIHTRPARQPGAKKT